MSRKLILASTMTLILVGTDVSALGLGKIRTLSGLNQPFSGEIELHDVNPDELDTVKVSIASQEAFAKAGLDRYYYLTKLTFTPVMSSQGQALVQVSSREPIREPYMDLLVEVNWPVGNQLVKEYTVLLDPPNRRQLQQAAIPAGHTPAKASSTSPPQHIPAPGDGFPVYIGPLDAGASLWRLARDNAPAGATVAQTAMALHRNNQSAFSRGHINRLIAGQTLVIPTRAELFALDAAAAEQEYATALRGGAVHRAPITAIPPEALASRLKLAGAAPPGSQSALQASSATASSPRLEQDLLQTMETSESTRQETLELRTHPQYLSH